MTEQPDVDLLTPDLADISVDDGAEPDDAGDEHDGTP